MIATHGELALPARTLALAPEAVAAARASADPFRRVLG